MSVFLADEQSEDLDLAGLRRLAELLLAEEKYPDDTEVTLLFVEDKEMASYNTRFLDRTGPTDVLAFPVEELLPGVVPETDSNGPPIVIGDVIVAPFSVRKQAEDYEVTMDDEMSLMIVHGILHLLGYDHQDDAGALKMEGREAEILQMVGTARR
jgi:probable rRNA maturation factor